MPHVNPVRKIIHIDMDAFYASVEQLDNPELRGKALAVGGSEIRGVVAAASYEARQFGVRSAMSGMAAKRNCPHLIFVPPRFDRYKELSSIIREVFYEYTDLVEPLSLDEAYLDVTNNKKGNPSATLIAQEIREKIKERTGLNASAGISNNKFVAKIASDINKPNGQKTIPPEEVISFVRGLDVKKFFGVGKVTKDKMYQLGIFTGEDLALKSLDFLNEHFGKSGKHYYNAVRGIHLSEVKAFRLQKSMASERTFNENISSEIFMLEKLQDIAEEVERRLKKYKIAGRTITLKIRYSDFSIQTRSRTVEEFLNSTKDIFPIIKELLFQEEMKDSVRLLGISMSNLNNRPEKKFDAEEPLEVQLSFEF